MQAQVGLLAAGLGLAAGGGLMGLMAAGIGFNLPQFGGGKAQGPHRYTDYELNASWWENFNAALWRPSTYGSAGQVTQPQWIQWTSQSAAIVSGLALAPLVGPTAADGRSAGPNRTLTRVRASRPRQIRLHRAIAPPLHRRRSAVGLSPSERAGSIDGL